MPQKFKDDKLLRIHTSVSPMPKKLYKKEESTNFFTKNGKILKSYKDFYSVCSLQDKKDPLKDKSDNPNLKENTESRGQKIRKILLNQKESLIQKAKNLQEEAKKTDKIKFSMISLGINAALILAVVFLASNNNNSTKYTPKYSIFSSRPLTSLGASTRLFGGDTRAATLDKVFEAYNCPLAGYGQTFVEEADKNEIPYWLLAAISFQESGCGKVTPKINISEGNEEEEPEMIETYNAWGWGVWGKYAKSFDNWEHGISAVSRYLGEQFYSKGVTDTCEIMKTYTPPSDGSWCRGVNYFGEIIQNYASPEN